MKTVKIILIAALVLAVGLSFFACRKTEPAEPGPTEQTGPEITIVNEAVKADFWILPDTEANRSRGRRDLSRPGDRRGRRVLLRGRSDAGGGVHPAADGRGESYGREDRGPRRKRRADLLRTRVRRQTLRGRETGISDKPGRDR